MHKRQAILTTTVEGITILAPILDNFGLTLSGTIGSDPAREGILRFAICGGMLPKECEEGPLLEVVIQITKIDDRPYTVSGVTLLEDPKEKISV